jgi:glycosyltransferase involved in cell wall biosynthesis
MTIDIFIPFWGDPELLYASVRSVLGQDDDDWRLTIVDDCYPDRSVGPTVEAFGDERVTYVRNDVNLGITDNYRRCLELAKEEWIVFLGCDDLLLPGYVRTIRSAIERWPQVDVIQPGVRVVDEEERPVRPLVDVVKQRVFRPRMTGPTVLEGEPLAASLLRGNWLYWPSLAFRVEAVRRHSFLENLPLVQDLGLVIDMTLAGSRLLVLPEEVFAYRRHAASASSGPLLEGARFSGERSYFDEAARRCQRHGWPRAARAARAHLASRIHAATLLPRAVRGRSWSSLPVLSRHALRP